MYSVNRKSILVVGAGGFIGKNIVRSLTGVAHRVTAATRTQFPDATHKEFLGADSSHVTGFDILDPIRMQDVLCDIRPNIVINAAAHGSHASERSLKSLFSVNVTGTANLADACLRCGVKKLVLLGSALEYSPSDQPLSEESAREPETLYGLTKSIGTDIARYFNRCTELEVTELRLFNMYGPYDDPRKLVPYVIGRALRQTPIELTSGVQKRDFVFVNDLCRIVEALIDGTLPGQTAYNVSSGCPLTVVEVARLIVELTKSGSEIRLAARPRQGDLRGILTGTSTLARFGMEPQTSLRSGLLQTIPWYQQQLQTAVD